ncbi:sucrose transporter protein [Canna indica]|uniref:Sucrose transporter protein n=1 Tax=Canna indica TaxID=4628 RepID=A0AAQ3KRU1_9LILI|nr:sucrose transporter protein [Canna indica]
MKSCCETCADLKGAFFVAVAEKSITETLMEHKQSSLLTIGVFDRAHLIVFGIFSALVERLCQKLTSRVVWVTSNFFMSICTISIVIISVCSSIDFHGSNQQVITADGGVRVAALTLFSVLGIPYVVLYSVPFAVDAELALQGGGGQGACGSWRAIEFSFWEREYSGIWFGICRRFCLRHRRNFQAAKTLQAKLENKSNVKEEKVIKSALTMPISMSTMSIRRRKTIPPLRSPQPVRRQD